MEIWKDIDGFEGLYQISSLGRIKSFALSKERILKIPNKKYPSVALSKSGEISYRLVHILLAKSFLPNPNNKPCVNHIDGNPKNNSLSNLEWCTYSENTKHAYKTGLMSRKGEFNHMAKLTEKEVLEIAKSKESRLILANRFGVSAAAISDIRRGLRWKHTTNISNPIIIKSKGSDMPNSKLDEKKVKEICLSKESASKLARTYLVSRTLIRKIKNGEAWPHISKQQLLTTSN